MEFFASVFKESKLYLFAICRIWNALCKDMPPATPSTIIVGWLTNFSWMYESFIRVVGYEDTYHYHSNCCYHGCKTFYFMVTKLKRSVPGLRANRKPINTIKDIMAADIESTPSAVATTLPLI
jgi:hypothetical protein